MCNCQPVIQGDGKLKKMIIFVQIILIVNLVSSFLRLFLNPSDIILDLFGVLFLYLASQTLYFIYMGIYIILSLYNTVMLFISCGTLFQMLIQGTLGDLKPAIPKILGISVYLLVFYIFAIVFTYPVYKEMKAQLMEGFGGGAAVGSANYNRVNDEERPSTDPSSRGFQAFAGRGVAVGGGN
jgi:hypothetical protein